MLNIIPATTLLLILIATSAHAAEIELGMQAYFRMVWGLAVVVAIMLAVYYLVRKRFSLLHPRDDKNINILEIQPIMPKKSLCLVEVHGKTFLLGITQDSITPISEITQEQSDTHSFAEQLNQSYQHRDTGGSTEP